MKYYIKRVQPIGDGVEVNYLDERGWFIHEIENALPFHEKEAAEEYLKTEILDPKYAKKYLKGCEFSIVETE